MRTTLQYFLEAWAIHCAEQDRVDANVELTNSIDRVLVGGFPPWEILFECCQAVGVNIANKNLGTFDSEGFDNGTADTVRTCCQQNTLRRHV